MQTPTLPEPPAAVETDLAFPMEGNATVTAPRRDLLHRPLPLWLRIVVLVVGWLVLLVGVAGLILPGIQGIATILLGLAILSVTSELAHRWMRRGLQRWPKLAARAERFRTRIHGWLHRMVDKRRERT